MELKSPPYRVDTDAQYVERTEGHPPQEEEAEQHGKDALEDTDNGRRERRVVVGAQEERIVEQAALRGAREGWEQGEGRRGGRISGRRKTEGGFRTAAKACMGSRCRHTERFADAHKEGMSDDYGSSLLSDLPQTRNRPAYPILP